MSGGDLFLFEPVQVVCLESREAHVVAAGAPVAGGAGGAGHAYFVGSFSNPVTPETHENWFVKSKAWTLSFILPVEKEKCLNSGVKAPKLDLYDIGWHK